MKDQWQPIEIAPKDGTWIILPDSGQECRMTIGRWWLGGWQDQQGLSIWPVHVWMPLPPPPTKEQEP